MKNIIRIFCAAWALAVVSCSGGKLMNKLCEVETFINDRPDSALSVIRSIDTLQLRTKAEKAKYSLLHAMALDKNYIDTTDTRIIEPAVEYYSRHGNADEKIKSFYYLGRIQYNGEEYSSAIVSFYKAEEWSHKAKDLKQLGILYAGFGDTYSRTNDYSEASAFIDKSIDFLSLCGREDLANIERNQKAQNLVNLREWSKAKEYYNSLLSDSLISLSLKSKIEAQYAVNLLLSQEDDDSLALVLFTKAIQSGKVLNDNQLGAYADALDANGYTSKSDSILNSLLYSVGKDNITYNYWLHRIQKRRGDYKNAYHSLWISMKKSDSLANVFYAISAANAQRDYLEKINLEKNITIQKQKSVLYQIITTVLLLLLLVVFVIIMWRLDKNKEKEKIAMIMGSLEGQLQDIKLSLSAQKTTAKLSYLSELFEIVYHAGDDWSDSSLKRVYLAVMNKVSDLNNDDKAKERFEKLLNKEANDIMKHFRNDFPNISDDYLRLASFIFAGFDNTVIMLLLDISSTNVRVSKSRLKTKILNSSAEFKAEYLSYFGSK